MESPKPKCESVRVDTLSSSKRVDKDAKCGSEDVRDSGNYRGHSDAVLFRTSVRSDYRESRPLSNRLHCGESFCSSLDFNDGG